MMIHIINKIFIHYQVIIHLNLLMIINQYQIIISKKSFLPLTCKFYLFILFIRILFFSFLQPLPTKEEIIDNSLQLLEPIPQCLISITTPNSPPDNRRISIRQQKRRTFRESSISIKKRTRLD